MAKKKSSSVKRNRRQIPYGPSEVMFTSPPPRRRSMTRMLLYLLLAGALVAGVIFLVRNQGVVLGVTTSIPTGTTADQVSNESPAKGWSWWSILLSVVLGLVVVIGVVVFLLRSGYFKKEAERMEGDEKEEEEDEDEDEDEEEYDTVLGKLKFLTENKWVEDTLNGIIDSNEELLRSIKDDKARQKKLFELVEDKMSTTNFEMFSKYSKFVDDLKSLGYKVSSPEEIKKRYQEEIKKNLG